MGSLCPPLAAIVLPAVPRAAKSPRVARPDCSDDFAIVSNHSCNVKRIAQVDAAFAGQANVTPAEKERCSAAWLPPLSAPVEYEVELRIGHRALLLAARRVGTD